MNREIKFRAWDEIESRMHPFGLYDIEKPGALGGQVPYRDKNNFEVYFSTWRKPLMQFTGLTDKNGKEIYESDRVRFRMYSGMENGHYEEIEKVIRWEDTGWNFTKYDVDEGCEVIGNEYEG